jgi:hypothetical protein
MNGEELYEEALKAIMAIYDDTSIPKEECIEHLDGLKDEINILLSSLN